MYLDLSNARIPAWFPEGTPALIPIVEGEHECDYDVMESLMPPGWVDAMHAKAKVSTSKTMPIGFNKTGLPLGAKII